MPNNKAWREEVEEDLASEFDQEAIREAEDSLMEINRQIQKYSSLEWAEVFEELRTEQQAAFKTMMSTDDEKLLITARERARIIATYVDRPDKLAREFAELSRRRQILSGEAEEEE